LMGLGGGLPILLALTQGALDYKGSSSENSSGYVAVCMSLTHVFWIGPLRKPQNLV
jgi:hypothetical protein